MPNVQALKPALSSHTRQILGIRTCASYRNRILIHSAPIADIIIKPISSGHRSKRLPLPNPNPSRQLHIPLHRTLNSRIITLTPLPDRRPPRNLRHTALPHQHSPILSPQLHTLLINAAGTPESGVRIYVCGVVVAVGVGDNGCEMLVEAGMMGKQPQRSPNANSAILGSEGG